MADALDKIGEELFGTSDAEAPAVVEAPVVEAQPSAEPAQAAPQEAQPAPEPQPAAQPEPKTGDEHVVPLAKFLDTRDELKELKRWKAEQEAKAAKPQNHGPFDDQETGAIQAAVARETTRLRFEMDDKLARKEYGEAKVEAAAAWAMEKAQSDPVFSAQYMREPHPIDWIVRQHQRETLLSSIGEDEEAYVRRRAAELGLNAPPSPSAPSPAPAAATQQAPAPAAPRPSLVNAPSGGGIQHVPTGPLAAVEAVFPG